MADFLCECDNMQCRETIPLELDELLFLRRTPGFVMIPGHQGPNDEIIGHDSDGRFVYVAEGERSARRNQSTVRR